MSGCALYRSSELWQLEPFPSTRGRLKYHRMSSIDQDAQALQPEAQPTGPEVVQSYLKSLPGSPGVYRMLDATGTVIYVGKARNLKARVSNYARFSGLSNRIARMVAATTSMEFVSVRTEAEALLLEANLIKRFRPRYNVLLRDDKSFPYILIRRDTKVPQILKHRGARSSRGDYFGPFASAGAVNRTINMLQRAFLLRSCSDSVFEGRTRPCLLYQIKRCAGPCTNEIEPEEYKRLVEEATQFLRGQSQSVRELYRNMMQAAAERLDYEEAARFRNRLSALAHVTADQAINPEGIEEADVFAAHQDGGQTCVQVFFFRTGQNWGNRAYYPRADKALQPGEVLESFIAQFYDDKPVPRLVLSSHDFETRELMEEALGSKAQRRVEIRVPQRGAKSQLIDHALDNAREALARKLAETNSQARLLEAVRERFQLPRTPARIEVFDNSHISGTNAVGAMIVAGPEGLVKGQYRRFNIKSEELTPGDDFGMMREVLERRFKRLLREGEGSGAGGTGGVGIGEETDEEQEQISVEFPAAPDVVLIDGGRGQLSAAELVLKSLGVEGPILIGVAKGPERNAGREHFHLIGREQPMLLEPRDPALYFLQRLRDEAHRFAIGAHRSKRSQAISRNALDEIDGIGPARKRALLAHFGSAKAVSRAGVDDLEAVKGVSAELAKKIYDFFHERS